MTKQVSTALSDLFLSLSCLLACYDIFLVSYTYLNYISVNNFTSTNFAKIIMVFYNIVSRAIRSMIFPFKLLKVFKKHLNFVHILQKKENVFLIYGFILLGLASFAGVARFSGCDSVKDLHKALSVHAGAVGLPWVLLLFASIQLNQGAKLSLVSPGWDILVVLGMHVCTTQVSQWTTAVIL